MTVSGMLTSGLMTALVPAYVEARDGIGRAAGRRLAGGVLTWVALVGAVLSIGLALAAGVLVSVAGPGLDAVGHERAVEYLQLLAPLAFLAAVAAILYALCQAEELFGSIAIASFASTATTLVILIGLWSSLELRGLAIGTLAGQSVNIVVLLIALVRASARPALTLRPSGLGLGALLRHAAPLTLSSAILQLNVVADRAIASLLAPGGVSALRYAEVLVRTPISAISPAWGAAMYPALVRAAQAGGSGVGTTTRRSLQYALTAFIPLATLTAAVAPVAVAVAYGRGAFTAADVERTARVVAAFAPLIVVLMTSPVLAGAHNARRAGLILLTGGAINVTLNFVFDVSFGALLGVAGIALSSSVATAIVAVFFARRLARTEQTFDLSAIARTIRLALVASLPGAAVIAAIAWSGIVPGSLIAELVALAAFGVVGLAVYAVLATAIGLEEARVMVNVALRPLQRARRLAGAGR
jgi:putative peptidoglycan lipid II flippase